MTPEELRNLIKLHEVLSWEQFCKTLEEELPALHSFMETWGRACGAPRSVFLGHLCAMLRDMMKEESDG